MTEPAIFIKDLPLLPWEEYAEERNRFLKYIGYCLGGFSLFFLIFGHLLTAPVQERKQLEKVPAQVAKMLLEKQQTLIQIPEVKLKPLEEPELVVEQEFSEPEKIEAEKNLKPKEAKKEAAKEIAEIEQPKVEATQNEIAKAKEKAAESGLLAMSDQINVLRQMASSSRRASSKLIKSKAGYRKSNRQNLITTIAKKGSGGIQVSKIQTRQTVVFEERQLTQLKVTEHLKEQIASKKVANNLRTSEEIALVFDQHKSSFYAIYRRVLRSQIDLEGRVLFILTISPSGLVTRCEVVSSELKHTELERKLVARIKMMNFGSRKVDEWKDTYHIDFSPI